MQVTDSDTVLQKILEAFRNEDLCTFALLSKRLHSLALPIIFRRHGFTDETQTIKLTLPHDFVVGGLLDALRISLSVNPILLFEVQFQPFRSFDDFYRVFNVISKVSVIRTLQMTFEDISFIDEQQWVTAFDVLCSALTLKSCARLQISRVCHGDTRIYRRIPITQLPAVQDRPRGLDRFLRLIRKGLLRSSSPLQTMQNPVLNHPGASPDHRLALYSLELNGLMPFAKRCLAQTLQSFSTVRVLKINWDPTTLLTSVLSLISTAAPELETLVVNAVGMHRKHFLDFIAQLSNLKELIIESPWARAEHHIWHPTDKVYNFRSLIRIRASPAHVLRLLARDNFRALPNLQAVELFLPYQHYLFSHYCQDLSKVMTALQANPRTASILPTLVVDFSVTVENFDPPGSMVFTLDEYLTTVIGKETAFACYVKIIFTNFTPLSDKTRTEVLFVLLPQWLRLFKALRHLTFSSYGVSPSIWTPFQVIRAISWQCPDIRTITIQDNCYDVAKMLREEQTVRPKAEQTMSFIDLPEDVIRTISDHLRDFQLFELAKTCRALSSMVLPVYLHRRKIVKPGVLPTVQIYNDGYSSLTDLSALHLSLSTKSVDHLFCQTAMICCRSFLHELLHRLRRFIISTSSINKVTLAFTGSSFTPIRDSVISDSCKTRWMALIISLLQAICARSCTSLTIRGCAFFNDLIVPLSLPYNTRPEWFPLPETDAPQIGVSLSLPLRELDIDAHAFHLVAIQYWMHFTLKDANHVSVLRITHAPGWEVPNLLNFAAIFPSLSELHLACSSAPTADILKLISSLPHLVSLYVTAHLRGEIEDSTIDGTAPQLPHLKVLGAPAQYIVFLLGPKGAMPALRRLELCVPFSSNYYTDFQVLAASGIVDRLKKRRRSPKFSLDLPIVGAKWMLANVESIADWESFAEGVTQVTLRHVEFIRVCLEKLPAPDLGSLDVWLVRWFPNVRRLWILGGFDGTDMRFYMDNMVRACPTLEGVIVRGALPPRKSD
ncbi:hypothetical protein FPV67DRAFT_1669837 [Lyophyllum atratum]|nr:hypothetical protein FPV67DRAFT_1669837 [Lyophyllum atratum]